MRYSDHGITIPTIWRQASLLPILHAGSQKWIIPNFKTKHSPIKESVLFLTFILFFSIILFKEMQKMYKTICFKLRKSVSTSGSAEIVLERISRILDAGKIECVFHDAANDSEL